MSEGRDRRLRNSRCAGDVVERRPVGSADFNCGIIDFNLRMYWVSVGRLYVMLADDYACYIRSLCPRAEAESQNDQSQSTTRPRQIFDYVSISRHAWLARLRLSLSPPLPSPTSSLCPADPHVTTPGRLLCSTMDSTRRPLVRRPGRRGSMFPARWLCERKCQYSWCVQAIRILYTSQLTYSHIRVTVVSACPSVHDRMRVALLPPLCPPSSCTIPRDAAGAHKQPVQPIHST